MPFLADQPIKSTTWTNGNAGIGFGGTQQDPQTGERPWRQQFWSDLCERTHAANTTALQTMAGGSKRADGKRLKKAGAGPKATAAAEQGHKRLRPDPGRAGSSVAAGTGQERRRAEERPAPSEAGAADQQPQRREMAGASEESRGPDERQPPGTSEAGAWHTPRGEFFVGEGEHGIVGDPDIHCNE